MEQCCTRRRTKEGLTESKENTLKAFKLPETKTAHSRKATAIRWREASDKQEHWLMHSGWLKSDQTCTQATAFPLTWPWPRIDMLVGPLLLSCPWCNLTWLQVYLQDSSKKGQWACHTHPQVKWFQLQLVENNNCQGGHFIFSAFVSPIVTYCTSWYNRGTDYVVAFSKQRYTQLSRPTQGSCPCTNQLPRVPSPTIRPFFCLFNHFMFNWR